MSKIFYISDTHFGHQNVIKYDNRPFSSVEEMDAEMTKRWNAVVKSEDTVYILGDFSFRNIQNAIEILQSLNGQKVLIKGNHDSIKDLRFRNCFIDIKDYLEVNDAGRRVILSHYPTHFWNAQFHDSIHLYGHVHNSKQWEYCEEIKEKLKEIQHIPMRMYNVGCMMPYMDYTPRTLTEILRANGENNEKS